MRNKILILLLTSVYASFLELVHPKTCPDEDIAVKCEDQCQLGYVDCTLACSDTSCLNDCGRALTDCLSDCPCNTNCPDGCNGCPNPICVCGQNKSPQNEDNLDRCKREKSIDLGQCIVDCNDNETCEQSCVNQFKDQFNQCPCQDDCPHGCPCNQFNCQSEKKSVLVLNTRSSNKPVLIKFDGGVEENFDFTMGPATGVSGSCSAMLNGELFVFGGDGEDGSSNFKQISKIVGCELKRIDELPNELVNGACQTFLFDGAERVMMCFPASDTKKCISYDGEIYTNHPNSIKEHYLTSLGNIENKVIAVGDLDYGNTDVELFDINSNTWTTKTSFPFCSSRIYGYGMISRQSSVLIFGGECDSSSSSLIARYTIDRWEHVGNLQNSRVGIRGIANDDRIYVVGGFGTYKTEIWSLDENDDAVKIKMADPDLDDYRYYPELFIVNSNFCTKK